MDTVIPASIICWKLAFAPAEEGGCEVEFISLSCPGIPALKFCSSSTPNLLAKRIAAKEAVILLIISPLAYILVKTLETWPTLLAKISDASFGIASPIIFVCRNLEVTSELLAIASVFIFPKAPCADCSAKARYSCLVIYFFHLLYNFSPSAWTGVISLLAVPSIANGGITNSAGTKTIDLIIRTESAKALVTVPLPFNP